MAHSQTFFTCKTLDIHALRRMDDAENAWDRYDCILTSSSGTAITKARDVLQRVHLQYPVVVNHSVIGACVS